MHGDSDGEATLSSLLVLCVTIAFFGSNFVPIKNVAIKNYAFFQWVMCNAILVTVIPWCLTQGRPVQLHPIAFIGGVAWCCGNYLCPMILDKLGLGVGSLLWGTVEMFVAWLSGTFGILGVERQTIQRPWLNFLGVMVVVAGGIVLAQVSSDTTTTTTTNDTSEFSALSSLPMDATELSPAKRIAEERKDNEDGGEAEARFDMGRIFATAAASSSASASSAALSPRGPTVYQLNPMLDRTSASMNHVSIRMRSSRDGNDVTTTTTTTTTPAAVSALDWSPPFHSANPRASVARDMHVSTPSSVDSLAKIPSSRATSSSSPSPAAGTGCPPLRTSASPTVTTTSTPIDPVFIHPGTGTGTGLLEDRHDSSVHLLGEQADVEKATTVEREPTTTTTSPACPKWLQLQPYEEGIALALVAGALFGLNFNPIQHLVDQSDGQVTAGALIVSHYVGICYTSYALLLLSMLWSRYGGHTSDTTQPSSAVLVDYECILPAIASGVMWGIGAIAWFVAAESLPISVTFPLISAGPNLVTMTWSLVYFREVRGRRDLGLLSLALTLLGLGLFCVWFSNL